MNHEATIGTQKHQENSAQPRDLDAMPAGDAAIELFKRYTRERPEVVALWAFGVGFVLGWKLKPW